jgi:hypothetical protein
MQAGPRRNATDVVPSYGLFLICRGEKKYIIYNDTGAILSCM